MTLRMMVLVVPAMSPFAGQMHAHVYRMRSVTWKQIKGRHCLSNQRYVGHYYYRQ